VLIAALHRDWGEAQGNYDELRFFTGLRPSEEIALVVTDYDAAHGVLSIAKARVLGIDKDVTKTGEDRRIVLCSRARAIIERQLRLRERLSWRVSSITTTCSSRIQRHQFRM
jgi:integrase